jgi:polysaccharide pyruvyl transferase WcaK-like protein
MRQIIQDLAKRYRVIIAPHVYADIELSNIVALGIKNVKVWNFSSFAFDNVKDSIGYYKHAEFVLAMRGHGQILPLSFSIPTISLENHDKNIGLMRKLNLEEFNVSIFDPDFKVKTFRCISTIERDYDALKKRLDELNNSMYEHTADEFNSINQLLKQYI